MAIIYGRTKIQKGPLALYLGAPIVVVVLQVSFGTYSLSSGTDATLFCNVTNGGDGGGVGLRSCTST